MNNNKTINKNKKSRYMISRKFFSGWIYNTYLPQKEGMSTIWLKVSARTSPNHVEDFASNYFPTVSRYQRKAEAL